MRQFHRDKAFAAVAILILGLGIGAATAVFSIVNGALLRPLPYREPGRLVQVLFQSLRERGMNKLFSTYADSREYSLHARTLESVAAITWAVKSPILTGRGPARTVLAIPVSAAFFDVLGASAAVGRTFRPSDENAGCSVVLAHSFWQTAFAADRAVIGQNIDLDGKSCAILGVMPREFAFYPAATKLWTLILPSEPNADKLLTISIARLKPGVTMDQVEAELSSLSAAIHANDIWRDFGPTIDSLQNAFTWFAGRNLKSTLWALLAAVALVLLIACVNVSNLILGRSLTRTREFAVRAALGAGRGRLFRQLLGEAVPLVLLAGPLGVFVAWGAIRFFESVNPVELPVGADISLDWRVLLFTFAISALAAFASAAAPGWNVSRSDANTALRSAGRGVAGNGHATARVLTAVEVALSVALLAGAGLLIQSVLRMGSADLGFHPEGLTSAAITLPADSYKDPAARRRFYEEFERRLSALAGIESAALTTILPTNGGGTNTLEVYGSPRDAGHLPHDAILQYVSRDYFATIGARLAGAFSPESASNQANEAIINQAAAGEYFPQSDPIGRRIRVGGEKAPWLTIVGIAQTERRITVYNEMEWDAAPAVYRPIDAEPPLGASLAIRLRTPIPIAAELREQAAAIDPNAAIGDVKTIRHEVDLHLSYPRFRAMIFAGFAAFALLLASIGLHAVLSQLVAQRTQEIGVRMAIGAQAADIALLIARQAGAPLLAGLAAGMLATLVLARYLSSMLYGVAPRDFTTLAAASAVLLVAAAFAMILPSRRAIRIDPAAALRE